MVVELDEAMEAALMQQAKQEGVGANEFATRLLRDHLKRSLDFPMRSFERFDPSAPLEAEPVDDETLERRKRASRELATFAKDRGIRLPAGVTVEDLLEEGRR